MNRLTSLQLIMLDDDWRPLHPEPFGTDWRDLVARLMARDCRWFAIDQQRRNGSSPHPVSSDIAFTRALIRRLRPLDMQLADHIIRAGNRCFSFRRAGLI